MVHRRKETVGTDEKVLYGWESDAYTDEEKEAHIEKN